MRKEIILLTVIAGLIVTVFAFSKFERSIPPPTNTAIDEPADVVIHFWNDAQSGSDGSRNLGQTPRSYWDDSNRCGKLPDTPDNSPHLLVDAKLSDVRKFADEISTKQLKIDSAKTLRKWEKEAIVTAVYKDPTLPDFVVSLTMYFFLSRDSEDNWRIFSVSVFSDLSNSNFARHECDTENEMSGERNGKDDRRD